MSANSTRTPLVEMTTVAHRLGLPLNSVYSMARRGLLPATKLGRKWKMDPDRLELWIAAGGSSLPGGWRYDERGA